MASDIVPTILVVDDNPAGRYATSRVLRAANFAVLEADTGAQGILLSSSADLVVLDVNLPDISGFETCRRIRASQTTARLPVIHLSASFVKDTDKVQGLDAGADGYLTHPVEPQVLVATVNAFLRTRRAEDEMRRSEAKFKAIFDQALSGILLVSKDLVCLEANPAMCAILGRSREEIVGRHNSSFVPAGHEQDNVEIIRQIEERGHWHGTFPMIRADGRHVELEWSIARHSVPGVRLAIVSDVTDRKAYEAERERLLASERAAREEAERANRLKDEFLATLSHELRTPLNAIVGWSQILRLGKPSDQDIAEGIDAIDRNAHAQAQLIADLLDVSRITSGNLRINVRSIDPAKTIRSALETMLPAITSKNIRLEQELLSDVGNITGDPDRIQQVVWNLVNNAVKFTPKGGSIRVRLFKDQSQVVLTVWDNGQGINAAFLPHIFERFRQENSSTRRNQGGLGLGLAIVKSLIEMHGGTIAAESAGEGKGATFTVRFPVPLAHLGEGAMHPSVNDSSAAPSLAISSTEPPAIEHPLDQLRVLIVDDDADARAVLGRVLTGRGATVRAESSVQDAINALAVFDPQMLVSDIGIPHQDGYDLIRSVRSSGYSPEKLPAIALTAFARAEDRARSIAEGFQIHLAKPVDARELLSAVSALMLRQASHA